MRRYRLIAEEHRLPLAAPRAQSEHQTSEAFFENLKPGSVARPLLLALLRRAWPRPPTPPSFHMHTFPSPPPSFPRAAPLNMTMFVYDATDVYREIAALRNVNAAPEGKALRQHYLKLLADKAKKGGASAAASLCDTGAARKRRLGAGRTPRMANRPAACHVS